MSSPMPIDPGRCSLCFRRCSLCFDHIYEVDPELMNEHTPQQEIPAWDTLRIVDSRWEHLAWMHDHFADSVVSGEELLKEIEAEEGAQP